ncbi:MAG: hypothetical protein L0312_17060 [Acidobacteria bacterium]|nr:hypothetical protein [Acidobacteriota bacterium]
MPKQTNRQKDGDPGGCCCLFVVYSLIGFVIAVFFPDSRDGTLIKPIVDAWDRLFSIPFPSLDLLSVLLAFFTVIGGAGIAFVIGRFTGKGINKFRVEPIDVNLIGAICSIAGLLVSIIGLFL